MRNLRIFYNFSACAMIFQWLFAKNENLVLIGTTPPGFEMMCSWGCVLGTEGSCNLSSTLLMVSPCVLTIPTVELDYGQRYQFSLTGIGSVITNVVMLDVLINMAPRGGRFSVAPTQGRAYDSFAFTCSDFVDEDLPLQYSFGYYRESGRKQLRNFQESVHADLVLPVGNRWKGFVLSVFVEVRDSLGDYSTKDAEVFVGEPAISVEDFVSSPSP